MKRLTLLYIALVAGIGAIIIINGCASSEMVTSKSGAQLWGENCIRCHNIPNPADYSDEQWDAIDSHMLLRANTLSEDEMIKVIEFLKSAN